MSFVIFKIWDTRHKRYTVNECRISRQKHHPGRVYISEIDVAQALQRCHEFYGDVDKMDVHIWHLDASPDSVGRIKRGKEYLDNNAE